MTRSARSGRRTTIVIVAAASLMATLVPPAAPAVLGGLNDGTLRREPLKTPESLTDGLLKGLQFADPQAQLAGIAPPEANSGGNAQLSYQLVMPSGRGLTPSVSLDYDSAGAGSWVSNGWDLTAGDVSVDTTFGVPLFCPRTTAPTCGNFESETYRLDGEVLAPTAVRTDLQPRVAERADFTRKVETRYDHIIRHGDSPKNYFWEVRDKMGNINWYGGYPDEGGPFGAPGTRTGLARNDRTEAPSSILTDGQGNRVRWYLKATRDVGVNMVRYEYDTVYYKAVDTTEGVGWQKVTAETCTGVCGKHVYLSKILYTGGAEASGQDEAPPYEVSFLRERQRPDPRIDGRGGVLDVDIEQLTRVVVDFTPPGGPRQKVVEYQLDTETGLFGKTKLTAVHQIGCATGTTCSPDTKSTHRFDYYDDVEGKGFEDPATWDTRNDALGSGRLEGKAGALGMSDSNAGDGHVYVGFNPFTGAKLGSFGGSITLEGSERDSLSEFMDINGDGLRDKVFRTGSGVSYRLNTSKPSDALDAPVSFEATARSISGLSKLPGERDFGVAGGVEAFFGVSAMFTAGGSWSWSKGYFADVNADGLPDWVEGASVKYNRLDCESEPGVCRPTFDDGHGQTRVPLNVRDVGGSSDEELQETLEMLRRLSPPIDTVRRWTAPYAGTVHIQSTARVDGDATPNCSATAGMMVAVQHNQAELGRCTLTAAGQAWSLDQSRTVAKGDHLYFRLSPDPDLPSSQVEWHPRITYTSFTIGTDANGLSQRVFDAGADFDLAGRPNSFVSMPEAGTVRYTGVVDKAKTSDYVRPTIRHFRGSAPSTLVDQPVTLTPVDAGGNADPDRQKSVVQRGAQWCLEYPDGTQFACLATQAAASAHLRYLFPAETGRFRTTSQFVVAAPITDTNGAPTAQDRAEFLLAVDSNIAATALRWVKVPELCYLDGSSCKAGSVNINPPVDTEVYPLMSATGPRAGYAVAGTSTKTVRVQFDVASGIHDEVPGDTMHVTVKGSDGSLARHAITIPPNGFGHYDNQGLVMTFKPEVRYWFDAHVRHPTLFEVLRNGFFQVSNGTDSNGNVIWAGIGGQGSFNSPGRHGYFGLGYRGWGLAGYLGNGDRRSNPLNEADLNIPTFDSSDAACQNLTGGPCKTSNDGLDFPGDYPDDYGPSGPDFDADSVESQFEKAYAFLPKRSTNAVTGAVREFWEGPRDTINGTATTASAARLGGPVPTDASGIGTLAPPVLKGQVSPSLALTAGVGPLTVSGGVGWTDGDVDYLDMNGDSFPDVVKSGSIQFTDPRGGHACVQEGGGVAACDGGGVGAVNEALTVAAGGGLGGSPVGFSSDTKGNTNGNGGGLSVRKGGPVSKDQYGASVGAGVEIGASWTSPVAKAPGWDDPSHGVEAGFEPGDFSEVPGDPMGDAGTELGRMLADVNGDGLPDQIRTNAEGVYARLNLGYGFAPDWVLWTPDSGFESAESYTGSVAIGVGFAGYFKDFSGGVSRSAAVSFPRYTWRDVNGDGILDALYKSDDEVRVAFGTGSGVMPGQKYGDTGSVEFSILGDLGVELNDQVRQQSSVGWGGGADFTIGIGPLCLVGCYIIINPGGHFEAGLTRTDVELHDVNGDGYADSVNRLSEGGHQEKLQVRLNRQGRTGLLRSVKNPLGGTMTLDYERKGNTLEHPSSLWVMKSLTVDDGRHGDGPDTTRATFDYNGLRYDFVNRQGLGFSTVTTRELGSSGPLRTTRERYKNASLFETGLQDRVELFDGDASPDSLLQRSIAEWKVLDGPTQQPLNAGALSADASLKAWATPLLSGLRHEWYVKGESSPKQVTAAIYEYGDRMGNPTRITDLGDLGTDADNVIAEVVYTTCDVAASDELAELCGPAAGDPSLHPPFWTDQRCPTWTSIPAIITVKDHTGTVLRHRDGKQALCDNSSVTLLRELISGDTDTGGYAETELAYDDWGSYDRIIYPLGENGRHYAVHYEYDPDRHSDVGQVTEYDLVPGEKSRFLGGPVGAKEDLPAVDDQGNPPESWEAWVEGEVQSVAGGDFVVRLSFDANDDGDTDDPADLFDLTVTGAAVPAWLVAGETAVVFGVLSTDQATLTAQGGVYRDFNEPWGDTAAPPLEAASVGLTGKATFNGRSGKVATRTDANGDTTSYEYDALGRLSRWQAADGGQVTYAYAPKNPAYAYATAHHSDQFNPGDTIDTVTFVDGIGRITQQKQETAVFQGVGQPPRNGFYVSGSLRFDALGNVVEETLPNLDDPAAATTFRARDAAQPFTARVYDKLDRLRQETLPDGRVTKTAYAFVPFSGTTASSMEYSDPMGRKTTTFSDVRGYPRASDDTAVGKAPLRTAYTNDLLGQLLSVNAAGRTHVANTYDLLGRRTSTDTEDTGRVDFAYDAVGNKVSSQSAVQRAAAGSKTTYRYSFGRLVAVDHPPTTPDVALTWGGYNGAPKTDHGAGRLIGVTDAARTQTLGYDANGRVDAETTAMVGADWKMGQLTTHWDFDWLGRTATTTYPDAETITQDFDLGGQLSSVSGQKACREVGRLVAPIDASQTTITVTEFPILGPPALAFVITVDGEQMRVTDRVATAVAGDYAYTVERGINGTLELPTATAHDAGTKVVTEAQLTCTYRYLDDKQYDLHGAPAFEQVGNGNRTQYQRDLLNRRLNRQVTTAQAQGRTSAGTLAAAVTAAATEVVVKELYAPPVLPFTATIGTEQVLVTGRAPAATAGQFTWTVQRGAGGTTAAAQASGAAALVDRIQQNLTYGYDPADNVTTYVDDLPPDVTSLFGGKVTQTYAYDGYYRLKSSTGTWNEAQNTRFYEYAVGWDDATGNMTSKRQRAWEVKVGCKKNCDDVIEDLTYEFTDVAYASGHQHRLATQGGETFTYDLDGNITAISSPDNLREMSWNDDGRMTMIVDRPNGSGGKPTHITYDYTGQVAKEDKEQGRSWFVNPWVTVKDGTLWKNVFAGSDRLGVKYSQDGYENRPYWFHKDLQGSTNVATDRVAGIFQHQQYLPTGEPWIDEDSTVFRTPYQFSGEYVDEDHDLGDFGHRWYEPAGQIFYSADPAVLDDVTAALEQPGLLSVYTLGFGNAVSNVDPDGRRPFQVTALRQTALLNDLRDAGVDSTRWPDARATQAIADFFQKHDGLGGTVAYGLVRGMAKLQAFADSLEQKPVLEFEFERAGKSLKSKHKLSSVKLGFGVGPRKKFEVGASQPPPRPSNPVPAPPQAQPPARPGAPTPALPQPANAAPQAAVVNAGGGPAAVVPAVAAAPRAPVAVSRARASSAPPIMGRSGGGNRGV